MNNFTTLLFLSFALLVSCNRYISDANNGIYDNDTIVAMTCGCDSGSSVPFTDSILKERYFIIEDSIGLYVGELEEIEELYYTQNVSNEELVQLSIAGLELQEKLRNYIKKTICDNIENALGLYMLAVYGELFTVGELELLIRKIPASAVYRKENPFYDIIVGITTEKLI